MAKKKPSKLILKDSLQDDCHYAFYIQINGKFHKKYTTLAGWDGSGLARWKKDSYDKDYHESRESWLESDEGLPSSIEEKDFINALKAGGIPQWVADLYIKEGGYLCNRDLKKIANDSNVVVDGFNQEEPWVHVDDLYQRY